MDLGFQLIAISWRLIEVSGFPDLKIEIWGTQLVEHCLRRLVSGHDFSRAENAAKMNWALAPARLLLCQIAVAKGILSGRFRQSGLHRVLGDIFPIAQEAFLFIGSHLGKPALPDLSQVLEFPLQAIGESSLDELHGLFNGHIPANSHEQMQVIGHDHEIVQKKFPCRHLRPQDVDQKHGISFGLEQSSS